MNSLKNRTCCKRQMDLIGVTEEGNYRYSCSKCYIIIEINEQLNDVRIVHKGVNDE